MIRLSMINIACSCFASVLKMSLLAVFRCDEAVDGQSEQFSLNKCLNKRKFKKNRKILLTWTLFKSEMEIADNGCCCFRVAVSCGGIGGTGMPFVLLMVFVFDVWPFVSMPFVFDGGAINGGGNGGGLGGSEPPVWLGLIGICI